MIAAAAGNVSTLSVLLRECSNVNAQDKVMSKSNRTTITGSQFKPMWYYKDTFYSLLVIHWSNEIDEHMGKVFQALYNYIDLWTFCNT